MSCLAARIQRPESLLLEYHPNQAAGTRSSDHNSARCRSEQPVSAGEIRYHPPQPAHRVLDLWDSFR